MKYRIGDICTLTKGATGIMKAVPGPYPMVALSEERKTHNKYQFDANAVIVPLISSSGHGHASMKRVHYQEGKFALGTILCAAISKDEEKLDAKFLHLYLQLFKDSLLVPLMKGAANVSLPMNKIADVEVEVPSLNRQKEIIALENEAGKYESILEEKLNRQEDDVKKLRQAFLREAMQGKLVPHDPNDEPASELLKKIKAGKEKLIKQGKLKKEKPLPEIKPEEIPFEIPGNWVWCRLGEIITFGPSNGYSPKENRIGNGIKCLTLTATTSGYFKEECFKFVDEKIPKDSYLWLKPGDILIQRGNSLDYVGIAALYNGTPNKFIYPDLMIKIRGSEFIIPEFLHKALISPIIRTYFKLNAFGSQKSMPKINQSVVSNTLIPLPPLSTQYRIVDKLNSLMFLCDSLEQSIKQSKAHTEMLLQAVLREALQSK